MTSNPYLPPATVETASEFGVEGYRPTKTLSLFLVGALAIEAVLLMVLISAASFVQVTPGKRPEGAAFLVLLAIGLGGIAYSLTSLVGSVLFLVWIYRANANARALGAKALEFTEGWCVAWFFIPLMNLFKPYAALREIYQASDPAADELDWVLSPVPWLLPLWWAAWLTVNIAGMVSFWLRSSIGPFLNALRLVIAAGTVAAAGLAILVVRRIERRQREKARLRAALAASGAL